MTTILVPESVHDELVAAAPEATLWPYAEEDGPGPEGLADADAVLRWVAGKRYAALVERGPNVRWLHTASAGVDHVLTPPVCAKADLTVTDSGPAFEVSISEFVLAWMLSVNRRLHEFDDFQRSGRWQSLTQTELFGQTVGIIGLGPIGKGVAERCRAFGMRVLGLRRRPEPASFVDETLTGDDGLRQLLAESDWVILCAALTSETRALLGPAQLSVMKPTAHVVNIARGPLIDEPALIDALQNGRLGGACLDVFAREPLPADSPLWTLPNVHISPHSSGWTNGLRQRQKQIFLDNLARFTRGEELANRVDIGQGY